MDDNLDIAAGQDPDLFDQLAGDFTHAQRAMVDEGLDHNPDDAAEAMQLGDLTGTPPEAILADQDDFKENQRRATAQSIVLGNPELVSYLQSHPMAAAVSNDDWANLDKFTRESSGLLFQVLMPTTPTVRAVEGLLSGAKEGATEAFGNAGDVFSDSAVVNRAEDPFQNELGSLGAAAAGGFYGTGRLVYRLLAGMQGGTVGALGGLGEAIGGPLWREEGERFAQYAMGRGDIYAPESLGLEDRVKTTAAIIAGVKGLPEAVAPRLPTALEAGRPFFDAGQEPPTGLHPDIDATKAKINQSYLERLDQDLQNATTSTTRERSSELFQKLTERMYGDSSIGIHADAVLGLYSDKAPEDGDGLLGWVPNIQAQLDDARETGADVNVPLKDWIAKVDPAVAKGLHDDIRIGPGGVTAREAAELPTEARGIVDGALPTVRAASSLEPKFSMGDRKLSLSLFGKDVEDNGMEMHDYDMLDENQQPVGRLRLVPGDDKTLLVAWVGGKAGLWSNSFGPALVRDLKRQLKTLYPDYDYLTGVRVTGARVGLASSDALTGAMQIPKVKLSVDDTGLAGYRGFQDILQNGYIQHSQNIASRLGQMSPTEQALSAAVETSLRKMGGQGFGLHPARDIQLRGRPDANVRGAYIPSDTELPRILYRLRDPGAGFHELLHHLRDSGMLSDAEWAAVVKGAKDEDWAGKYGIAEKYGEQSDDDRTEEAAAHHMEEWIQRPDELPKTGWGKVFKKIIDFLSSVKESLGFKAVDTWEDVFKRIESGEIANRAVGGGGGLSRLSLDVEHQANIEGITNLQAASVGMDLPHFRRLQDAIRKRAEGDLAAATAQAQKEQTKRQSAEWKSNRAAMATEVSKDIQRRPDVAADLFIGNGEFNGEKLRQRFTLAADKLTPEQKAGLPDHYVSANGLDPDAVAGLFGYSSGSEMVGRLADLERLKTGADGARMRNSEFVRGLVQKETDRRMELRYGNLPENILDAARDQALSDSSVNVMYEELRAVAESQRMTAFDKSVLQATADKLLSETSLGKLSSFRIMQEMDRHGRNAEKAMLDGDFPDAAVHMQKQTVAMMVAKGAKAVEGEMAKFDKLSARWAKRDQPSVPPEYANWVHSVLRQVGKPVRRTAEDIKRQIGQEVEQTLQDFVKGRANDLSALDVWDRLFDPNWRSDYKDLTVDEFRHARDSVDTLISTGRRERKVYAQGEAYDRAAVVDELVGTLDGLNARDIEQQRKESAVTRIPRGFFTRTTQVENLFGKLDGFEFNGPWFRYLLRDLIDGANQADAWRKEYAKKLAGAMDDVDLSKKIDNKLFRAPDEYGGNFIEMNRASVRKLVLDWGNTSNKRKVAKGWNVAPEAIDAFLAQHAEPEDYDFAQRVWDIEAEMKERSDTMFRSMGRMAPKTIEATPFTAHGKQYTGGYLPIMWHDTYARIPALEGRGIMEPGYESWSPPAGYTQSRVNFFQPTAMDLEQLPGRMDQVIHDTAMRPSIENFVRTLHDPKIKAALITKVGRENFKMLEEYIKGVANKANTGVSEWKDGGVWSRYFRENIQTSLVGFNILGTGVKHFSTAFVTSAKEVGPVNFIKEFVHTWPESYARAIRDLYTTNDQTSETRYQFAMDNSLELQRRERNYIETIGGTVRGFSGGSGSQLIGYNVGPQIDKFMNFRQRLMELSSKPLAFSDKLSSVPTWLAAYDHAAETMPHGDAVAFADRAVRRAHGSTAITSRPVVMGQLGPWLTGFYNFFNDIFNRQLETAWRAGLMMKQAKEGQHDEAMKQAKFVAAGIFAYSIWPAVTENWSSPQKSDPQDSWLKRSLKAVAYTESATLPIVREVVNGLLNMKNPDYGMVSTAMGHMTDAYRDLWKRQPMSPAHAQVLIKHTGELAGILGAVPQAVVNPLAYTYGVHAGTEHPQGPWGWLVGARYGTTRGHSQTVQQYMQGQYDRRR